MHVIIIRRIFSTPRPPTRLFAYLQQAFIPELATACEWILLYFYSPGPYSEFKAKSFKAYGLLRPTCCHESDYYTWQRQQTTALNERKRKAERFSQIKHTETHLVCSNFVWTGTVALNLTDQYRHWQTPTVYNHSSAQSSAAPFFKQELQNDACLTVILCVVTLRNYQNWWTRRNIKRNTAFCLWQQDKHELMY